MMILDRITDWIVTAWEFIGLLFLSGGTNPLVLGRWEAAENCENHPGDTPLRPNASAHSMRQPHFV
jgi:hypothetical protein